MIWDKIDKYLLSLPGVTVSKINLLNSVRYVVHDKPFAVITHTREGDKVLNLRLNTNRLLELRSEYPNEILPSIEFEPLHWNLIYIEKIALSDKVLFNILKNSYSAVFRSLSELSKIIYTSNEDLLYNYKFKKIPTITITGIEYGKKVIDLDDDSDIFKNRTRKKLKNYQKIIDGD